MTNTRPRSGRKGTTRRERRTAATASPPAPRRSAAKVYTTPQASAATRAGSAPARSPAKVYTTPAAPRRSYIGEPAPVDHSGEFRAIRHDLLRILLWASLLIIAMIVLAVLPIL